MEMQDVYLSFVKIKGKKGGGDFYIVVKSTIINSTSDLSKLNISPESTKTEVLDKLRTIDPDANVIGGVILKKNETPYLGAVMSEREFSLDDVIDIVQESADKIIDSLIKKGGR